MATKSRLPTPSRLHKAPARLTATRVDSVGPGEYTDLDKEGLQLRVRSTRKGFSRTWLFRYRWREEWVRLTLGHRPSMSHRDAKDAADVMRRALDSGIDPRRARPSRRERPALLPLSSAIRADDKHTVDFLASEFMERHVKPHRRRPEYVQAIMDRDVLASWRGRDARSIKPREVIELLDGIVARGSRVMANRTAAILGQLFKFGIHRSIVDDSPVKLLMRPGGKEKPRGRALSDPELKALLADPIAATRFERLARVITILLLTGQRRGELALARWRDIDFKAQTWTIPDENSKIRGHVVPLTDWALREFQALKNQAGRSMWVLPGSDPTKPLDAKLLTRGVAKCQGRFKKLGIAAFTLHDLRRTCRTGLAKLGVEPHIAERVLNHAQEKIPGTYDVHDYVDEKRAALVKWADHVEALRPTVRD